VRAVLQGLLEKRSLDAGRSRCGSGRRRRGGMSCLQPVNFQVARDPGAIRTDHMYDMPTSRPSELTRQPDGLHARSVYVCRLSILILSVATRVMQLLQLRVLDFGLFVDRNVRVSVFPETEKVLGRLARGLLVAHHGLRPAKLQV
jgi:hypothetical protein